MAKKEEKMITNQFLERILNFKQYLCAGGY